MKIIYLLPPSEGKNAWWNLGAESLTFDFQKPCEIAINATQKDLKCKDARYEQGIKLNKKLYSSPSIPLNWGGSEQSVQGEFFSAIERYSWVMYNAINYEWMSESWKKYFSDNFIILSGMYWIVKPLDNIWNYKLPIETKWLYKYWWNQITASLNLWNYDYIVDLLPGSYAKMIDWKSINSKIIRINFMHNKDSVIKKITHWVKKVKGEYIHKLCNNAIESVEKLEWEKVQISENEYHINVISK